MPKPAKMRLTGRMFLLCPAPIERCSTVNHTCSTCGGSHVIVIEKDARGRVVVGPAATDPLKFPLAAQSFRVQDSFSAGTEWGHRHIEGKVYRRGARRRRKK